MENIKFMVISKETKKVIGYASDIFDLEKIVYWSGYYIHELDVTFGSVCNVDNRYIYAPSIIKEDLPLGSYLEKYDKPTLFWIIAVDQEQKERFRYEKSNLYQDLKTMEIFEITED